MTTRWLLPVLLLALGGLPAWSQTTATASTATTDGVNWSQRYDQAKDLLRAGKEAEAIDLGNTTVRLTEAQFGPEHDTTLDARRELAQLYLRCHRFPDAEKTLRQVLDITERRHDPDDPRVADALYDLAWFYSNLSNYAAAEPLFLRALAIYHKPSGRHNARSALVLNSLGVLYENKGDYARAESHFLEAIAIQQDILGSDSATLATTINNLATLHWIRGDYRQAERFFAQALAIREKTKGRGSLATATTVNNLALVYLGMGDYSRAETLFWRVLRIREQKLGVNHPLTLTTVNHLGLLYYDLGDYTAAESFLQRAAQTREKVIGTDQPDTARALFHLAYLYDTIGQYQRAEPLHLRALDIRHRILGDNHPETAASYAFLARHYHLSGQPNQAAPLYEKALAIQRTVLGSYHPDLLKTLEGSACLQLQLAHRDQAAALAREASALREHLVQNLFLFTSEKQRIDFQRTLRFYDTVASLGDATEIARTIYRTKGVVLDSILEDKIALARAANDPAISTLLDSLQSIARKLDQNPAATDREPLEREADRLQLQLADKLGRERSSRRALAVEPTAVATALPAHTALVEFIRYQACAPNLTSRPAYGAIVQRPAQAPQWIELGPADRIETLIQLYQKYVRRRVRDSSLESVLVELGQRLWQPIEAALGNDCQRVVLSPDAALHAVSFATLLCTDDHFVAEKYSVEYISCGRDLVNAVPAKATSESKQLVIFSSPEFGSGSAKNNLPLASLPGTQREAEFLQKNAPQWGLAVEFFGGPQATETNLRRIDSPLILHLATHGFAQQDSPAPITRPTESMPNTNVTRTIAPIEAHSSWLALSGAALTLDAWQRGDKPAAASDGIVTAEEISTLHLTNTWLVVLSACDSGLGTIQSGEGVLGLRRGFRLAGTRQLLLTLWPVEDASSVAFIEAFYRAAVPSRDAASAITQVQRDQLVQLRKLQGLWQAVRSAGPYILMR